MQLPALQDLSLTCPSVCIKLESPSLKNLNLQFDHAFKWSEKILTGVPQLTKMAICFTDEIPSHKVCFALRQHYLSLLSFQLLSLRKKMLPLTAWGKAMSWVSIERKQDCRIYHTSLAGLKNFCQASGLNLYTKWQTAHVDLFHCNQVTIRMAHSEILSGMFGLVRFLVALMQAVDLMLESLERLPQLKDLHVSIIDEIQPDQSGAPYETETTFEKCLWKLRRLTGLTCLQLDCAWNARHIKWKRWDQFAFLWCSHTSQCYNTDICHLVCKLY